jgi:hypothetical protein
MTVSGMMDTFAILRPYKAFLRIFYVQLFFKGIS